MPSLLIRFLPHILAALAVIGFVAFIDHRGYERAQADQAAALVKVTKAIDDAVGEIDTKTAAHLASIDSTDRTIIQPMLTREIASDPRYSNPACSLTPGVFDALNRARSLSAPASADGGTVPPTAGAD